MAQIVTTDRYLVLCVQLLSWVVWRRRRACRKYCSKGEFWKLCDELCFMFYTFKDVYLTF